VGSRPVAGTAGNSLPRFIIEDVDILLDGKDPAARRAAQGHRLSAKTEFNFFIADLAFHSA